MLEKTIKHGKETKFEDLPVFEYRMNYEGTYRKYRATINEDGTIRTFHPLD
jgi:hypothetical protein